MYRFPGGRMERWGLREIEMPRLKTYMKQEQTKAESALGVLMWGWGTAPGRLTVGGGSGREESLNNPSSVAMSDMHCYNLGENQPFYATNVMSFLY